MPQGTNGRESLEKEFLNPRGKQNYQKNDHCIKRSRNSILIQKYYL
jgi:hypothetical protein